MLSYNVIFLQSVFVMNYAANLFIYKFFVQIVVSKIENIL